MLACLLALLPACLPDHQDKLVQRRFHITTERCSIIDPRRASHHHHQLLRTLVPFCRCFAPFLMCFAPLFSCSAPSPQLLRTQSSAVLVHIRGRPIHNPCVNVMDMPNCRMHGTQDRAIEHGTAPQDSDRTGPWDTGEGHRTMDRAKEDRTRHRTLGPGRRTWEKAIRHRTYVMAPEARAQPKETQRPGPWPACFLGLGPGKDPIAHDVGPPMAWSYVQWACPVSYGPVLSPMALSDVPWPCVCPMAV